MENRMKELSKYAMAEKLWKSNRPEIKILKDKMLGIIEMGRQDLFTNLYESFDDVIGELQDVENNKGITDDESDLLKEYNDEILGECWWSFCRVILDNTSNGKTPFSFPIDLEKMDYIKYVRTI